MTGAKRDDPNRVQRRRAYRERRFQAIAMAALLLIQAPLNAAAPTRMPAPSPEVLEALRTLTTTLQTTAPPRFVLHYRGPVTQPFGPLCYRFAGYNETCRSVPDGWLTPAMTLELYAPGGVPLDLLIGYQLELRFPYWTEEVFKPQHRSQDTHE